MSADPSVSRSLDAVTPSVSADCHFLCAIGTAGDHHGTLEYRCVDANGYVLPFDGGDNMHSFGCDCPDCPEWEAVD